MRASEVMTPNPVLCTPEWSLKEVAELMARNHCGAVPVVDAPSTKTLLGIITDRDITCRAVAGGRGPDATSVRDCMTAAPMTVFLDTSLEACCLCMEVNHIRRLPVVDSANRCLGIITQTDIAERAPVSLTVEVIREVSFGRCQLEPRD
jgi:CBS domain-containing protein